MSLDSIKGTFRFGMVGERLHPEQTLRDEVKDRVSMLLQKKLGVEVSRAYEIAGDISDTVFDALHFSDEIQDGVYEEYEKFLQALAKASKFLDKSL